MFAVENALKRVMQQVDEAMLARRPHHRAFNMRLKRMDIHCEAMDLMMCLTGTVHMNDGCIAAPDSPEEDDLVELILGDLRAKYNWL